MDIQSIAEICHEANRALCLTHGDDSQPSWGEAPDWQVESAKDGVKFYFDNPDAPPSASHDNWMAHKVADGWKHGRTKDPEAKTHPCLVPFDQLPREQQAKDRLFTAIVSAFAPDIRRIARTI